MVAYSFNRQFVAPISVGLGLQRIKVPIPNCRPPSFLLVPREEWPAPKRQTIRADRKRHARPGEELQLYCGMRTKGCFLIGRARCVSIEPIYIRFHPIRIKVGKEVHSPTTRFLDEFGRADGFADYNAFVEFWAANHGVNEFRGVIIKWEPLS